MAESERYGIGVDLEKGEIGVDLNSRQNNSWSLGCDIKVEEAAADIQEIRVGDITLSGNFSFEIVNVNVNAESSSYFNLDVIFGGSSNSANIEVDTMMSDESVNPVQNKVIKAYADKIDKKANNNASAIRANADAIKRNSDAIIASESNVITAISDVNALKERVQKEEDVTAIYEEWWKSLKEHISVDEENNVVVDTNLIVSGDTSSNGSADGSVTSGVSAEQVVEIVEEEGYAKKAYVDAEASKKQDKINDLSAIRSGAALGTTSVQPAITNALDARVSAAEGNITSIDTDIATINETISTLNSTLASLQSLFDALSAWQTLLGAKIVIDADGNVNINTNLIVGGDVSSNA